MGGALMEITDVSVTKVSTESWGEFVELPTSSPMMRWEEFKNAGDNPDAIRNWVGPVGDVFVEIETDAGVTGYGHGNWGTGAIATVIDETLSKLLVGRDPTRREELWDMMYRATLPFGRRGVAVQAISAVDIALWDIAGKAQEKPVYELLGGPVREEIPCYASNLYAVDLDKLEREAADYAERGFETVKLRFKHGPEAGRAGMEENERLVATVREAVGDDVAIAADVYKGWTVRYAKQMLPRLEQYDLAWLEEPVIPDNVEGYAEIRESTSIPISGGEAEFTRWGFKNLLDAGAVDILQPDLHCAGGFTEMKRIADLASTHDKPIIPHAATPPTLHFLAATTNAPLAEYFPIPIWYAERKDATYVNSIYAHPPEPEDGTLPLPDRNGAGTELDHEVLERYAVE